MNRKIYRLWSNREGKYLTAGYAGKGTWQTAPAVMRAAETHLSSHAPTELSIHVSEIRVDESHSLASFVRKMGKRSSSPAVRAQELDEWRKGLTYPDRVYHAGRPYDFGYYTKHGCVIYRVGERNMQDSYSVGLDSIYPTAETETE